MGKIKKIRFKPDCVEWIKEGKKTTTFRKTRRWGLYEIVKGDWYHPVGLGILIECKPLLRCNQREVIYSHFSTEGVFNNPQEFIDWLRKNDLSLPEIGWLNNIEYCGSYGK